MSRSGRDRPADDGLGIRPESGLDPELIVAVPPRMTIRLGRRRVSSVAMGAGRASVSTSRTGPPAFPATGAPESASVNTRPEATYATSTPGA